MEKVDKKFIRWMKRVYKVDKKRAMGLGTGKTIFLNKYFL